MADAKDSVCKGPLASKPLLHWGLQDLEGGATSVSLRDAGRGFGALPLRGSGLKCLELRSKDRDMLSSDCTAILNEIT